MTSGLGWQIAICSGFGKLPQYLSITPIFPLIYAGVLQCPSELLLATLMPESLSKQGMKNFYYHITFLGNLTPTKWSLLIRAESALSDQPSVPLGRCGNIKYLISALES